MSSAAERPRVSVSHRPAWCNRASLLPDSHHNPALLRLFRHSVPNEMIIYVAQQLFRAIPVDDDVGQPVTSSLPTPPHTPHKTAFDEESQDPPPLLPLEQFIWHVIRSANVPVPILLATIVYLRRLHNKLPRMAKGIPCTRHRVFLATLIVAAKYLNDACPKNKFWAEHAPMFQIAEINLMESQLLFLLDYDLRFDETEACANVAYFLRPLAPRSSVTRQKAVSRVAQAGKARAAQASLPPTPPTEPTPHAHAPAQVITGAVHSIAKRFSSVVLANAACEERQAYSRSPLYVPLRTDSTESSDTGSSASSSGTESEGASEAGSSMGSTASSPHGKVGEGANLEGEAISLLSEAKSVLRPVPASAHRRRKGSDATLTMSAARGSSTSLNTVGSDQICAVHAQPSRNSLAASPVAERSKVTPSRTMPALPVGASGFLSRMWGAATKGTPGHGGHSKTPVVATFAPEITEPQEALLAGQAHSTGAFHLRRLAHSRSAMFRGSAVDVDA